ncbi:MAG: methyltransferase domain-containing protein [Desulfovibrionaceae bacterium]|nr:methyltransferase domain-containing protein [Desulfovibrionaceae bacterium]
MDTRCIFTSGLLQPEHSFRFSQDALLLAGFANALFPAKKERIADLGCGSGAALLALASLRPLHGLGIDISEELLACARVNADRAGLANARFICADLTDRRALLPLAGSQEAVLTNPPFYTRLEGRPSKERLRDMALRGGNGELIVQFCSQAARLLMHHGFFLCIYPANKVAQILRALCYAHLGLRALCSVHETCGAPASRILVLARKNAEDDCVFHPPLILHADNGAWQPEARALCPWLGRG